MEIQILDTKQIKREGGARVYTKVCPTITSRDYKGALLVRKAIMDEVKIRKITPTECFRLMGFTDIDIERCKAVGMSNSQLYKQAGNSIVVPVLEAIFGQMFEGLEDEWKVRWSDPVND